MISNKTINIGIVCSPWLGGSGVVGTELAKALQKTGRYKIKLISFESPFRIGNKELRTIKAKPLNHSLFPSPLYEAALVEKIIEAVVTYKLDIIHAHFAIPFAYSALQAREILGKMGINIKVVTTLHGTDILRLGKEVTAIMRYIIEQSDTVTAVSYDLAKLTQRLYKTKKQISIVYNFFSKQENINQRSVLALRKKLAGQGQKVIIHISNFRPIKRIQDTLTVFFKVSKQIPAVLLLIGEGPDYKMAKKYCQAKKVSKSVYFIGRVKNPYKYLSIADALLITSEYESFCLVGLEAMAMGVSVFGTKVGGIPEVVTHGKSGYLAKLGDTDKLTEYIVEVFKDSNKMEEMKNQALKEAERFSESKILPEYEFIYSNLMSKRFTNKLDMVDTEVLV